MKKLYIVVILSAILLASCASPNASYVDASYRAFDAIVPLFVHYVDDDPNLKREDKDIMIKSSMEALKMAREEKERLDKE